MVAISDSFAFLNSMFSYRQDGKQFFTLSNNLKILVGKKQTFFTVGPIITGYRNDPNFSDRYVWANNADPDQIAPLTAPTGVV